MKLFKQVETKFEAFDLTVRSYLSKVFSSLGMQYSHTQIFGVIFDGMKGIMQNIMFYIEDAFTEQNVETASRRTSIFSLAKISGFEAEYGHAASGTLTARLHINNGLNNKISNLYLNNHTIIVNKNTGMSYSLVLPTNTYMFSVSDPLIECEFHVVQGLFEKTSYTAKGNNLETVHITCKQLFDQNYINVYVDGVKWKRCYNFYDMTENGEEFIYSVGYDNQFDIIFGNGVYGKKLKEGQLVQVEFLKHQGIYGNVNINDLFNFIFAEHAYDNFGNSVNANDYITLSMESSISGGSNADNIEFVRNMIGKNSKSLVYGDIDSIKVFLKRFSFIGYTNAYLGLQNNIIYVIALQNFNNLNKEHYDYFKLNDNELLLDENQKNMIIETINNSNHMLGGFKIQFVEPIIRKYSIVTYVKINNNYLKEQVQNVIYNAVYDFFSNLSFDVKFIAKSSIINYILAQDTDKLIESLDINIISDYNEQSYYNTTYKEYTDDISVNNLFIEKNLKYSLTVTPGLDQFGNISLNSTIEIPRVCGGFKYYINKSDQHDISDYIITKPVEIYFI